VRLKVLTVVLKTSVNWDRCHIDWYTSTNVSAKDRQLEEWINVTGSTLTVGSVTGGICRK